MAGPEQTPTRTPERSPGYRMVQSFAGLALSTACLTMLFLSMRAVMDIGGSCGSGGPYSASRACPEGVAWMIPVSIIVGLIALGYYAAGCSRLPGPRLMVLAWPALFLSLGVNFWDYGLNPPGQPGPEWGWIICAVVFTVIGGVPLVVLGDRTVRRAVFWADAPGPRGPVATAGLRQAVPRRPSTVKRAALAEAEPDPARPDLFVDDQARDALDVAAALERAARLHRDGALSDAEFAAAKDRILGGGT